MRPYTTVTMMDKLGTFAGQQHQDLSPQYREESLRSEIFLCTCVKGSDAVDQQRYLTYPSYSQ